VRPAGCGVGFEKQIEKFLRALGMAVAAVDQAQGVSIGGFLLLSGITQLQEIVGAEYQAAATAKNDFQRGKRANMPDEPNEIDLVIGTNCISEGQNLQDCDYLINYDIHWNPVRIIQRFGRIDRIGSTNASIQLVNYWPDISLDEYINLKEQALRSGPTFAIQGFLRA